MRHRIATILIVGCASLLGFTYATAGPCGVEIESFQRTLQQQEQLNPDNVGTAAQTIAAQLEHQPTPKSVERAKNLAKSEIAAVLARAEKLDAEERQRECLEALATARLLLNP
jgi:hypothetical protein